MCAVQLGNLGLDTSIAEHRGQRHQKFRSWWKSRGQNHVEGIRFLSARSAASLSINPFQRPWHAAHSASITPAIIVMRSSRMLIAFLFGSQNPPAVCAACRRLHAHAADSDTVIHRVTHKRAPADRQGPRPGSCPDRSLSPDHSKVDFLVFRLRAKSRPPWEATKHLLIG